MPPGELERLESVDLSRLTLGEVVKLKNPILRKVLIDVIDGLAARPEHTSHANHSNHYKTIATLKPDERLASGPG
jgi:hypothetical protein